MTARLGELHVEILSAAGRRVARHRRAPAGAGQQLRQRRACPHVEQAVLDAFTTDKPCRRKANRPPGDAAVEAAARLRGHHDARRGRRRSRGLRADRKGRAVNKHATYQQLRGHLAYLKLTAAAEQLPAALEAAERPSPATPSSCTTCSTSRSPQPANAASPAGCGSPASHPPRRWRSLTSPPNHRSIAASSTSSRHCASSKRRPTFSRSARPASGRRCSRSPWA